MICDLCASFSPRYAAGRRCCHVRQLSTLPKERRKAEYERVDVEEGRDAMRALIEEVKTEYLRRVAAGKAKG